MNRNSLSVFLAIALVFILSSFTASAQQPRAVPSNDNFISAQAITIGKNYKVPDIGAATNEGGDPITACNFGSQIPNSVWFTFTLPEFSRIYLSTAGTVLVDETSHDYYTVIAIYELTGGVLTERDCSSYQNETPFAQMEFIANADTTYYIAAGTRFTIDYLPGSTLKLNTRLLRTAFTLPNSDFETPINPATDWKLKNADNDQVVCSDAGYPALNGSCAFRFTGSPGVTTKLVQTMPFPTVFQPRKEALLGTVVFFRIMDTPTLGTTKIKVVVSYGDGTPPTIQTADLTGTAPTSNYNSFLFWTVLKSAKVASVKFQIKFASPTGTLLVDIVNVPYEADVVTRGGGLLPVPPAVGEMQ